ncbi:MAG TPA: DNA-processing protein DprA [Candidatus Saccharimonadales bacterium]|nr:DNA-processing protein DprA [Candidatus Saccharimonadales bacterium]
MKVNSLKRDDPSFPAILKQIHSVPEQLFWLGSTPEEWLQLPRVAVVGSRKVSAYGREVTSQLAKELAKHGVVVISGLALGVDSIAHQAALEVGGQTIAILPAGLDKIYPASHAGLARSIIAHGGALVSEYPLGATPHKQNFIARNRIVSGLVDVLVITEAAAASGSLHTARFALEQGKTVMAVPGNITSPLSEGANNLIKSGAVPVTGVEDVLFALGLEIGQQKIPRLFSGNDQERAVFELITSGITAQEDLAIELSLDGASLATILTMLEINGHIRPAGAGYWLVA